MHAPSFANAFIAVPHTKRQPQPQQQQQQQQQNEYLNQNEWHKQKMESLVKTI